MYSERIKVIIRQADPYDKKIDSTKWGWGLQNLTSPKHLKINYFHV